MKYLVLLLTLLAVTSLRAAELTDPTTSWNPRQLLTNLVSLRAPLDQTPQDPVLLARLQQTYVELAFGVNPELNGAIGPWLVRAETIAAQRAALRQGKPPATFAEAEPDLWLAIVQGNTAAVMTDLARWPEETAKPSGRALRMAAARDLRGIDTTPPRSALEWYGYFTAMEVHQAYPVLLSLLPSNQADSFLVKFGRWTSVGDDEQRRLVQSYFADVVWMLSVGKMDDAVACTHLATLITSFGQVMPTGDRQAFSQAAQAAVHSYTADQAEPLIAAARICTELSKGEHLIRDAEGKHRLVSLADVATWLHDRLYLAALLQLRASNNPAYSRTVGKALETALPGSLIAARTSYNDRWPDTAALPALGKAIEAGAFGGADTSPGVALLPVSTYLAGVWRDGQTVGWHQHLVTRLWPDAQPTRMWGLIALTESIPNWTCRDNLARAALAGSRRDPYLQSLWEAGRWADPTFPLMDLDIPPDLQRIDAQLGIPAVPIAGTDLGSKQLGARWAGDLQITVAGDYRFAVESERASRLIIGDTALVKMLPGRREMTLTLTSGWIPLHMEWWQGMGGKGRVAVFWKIPGAADFVPVPPAVLGHGPEHQPGLEAAYWKQVKPQFVDRPRAVDIRRAESMPWQPDVQAALADAYLGVGQAKEALAVLKRTKDFGITSSRLEKLWLRALAREGDPQHAAEVLALYAKNRCCNNSTSQATNIAKALARGHLQEELPKYFEPGYEPCCVGPWIFARMALGRGDWPQTLHYLDALKVEERDLIYWHIRLEQILLRRAIANTEPDWAELRELANDKRLSPAQRLFLAWYTGDQKWAAVVAQIPETSDGDEVYWYRSVHDLTSGDFPAAIDAWQKTNRHPNWIESADADMMLDWYGHQTPETLAKLPKAKPLPTRSSGNGSPNF